MAKPWKVGMADEKDGRTELPDGDQIAEIKNVRLVDKEESKSGNPYFLWTLDTAYGDLPMITTLIKGKRWLLKQTLSACGIESKDDDPEKKYVFTPEDVVGKTIIIQIKNVESSFVGREGEQVTVSKSEVKRVKPYVAEKPIKKTELEGAEQEEVEAKDVPF